MPARRCLPAVRKAAYALGYRFRLNCHDMPGHPHMLSRRLKTIVFVCSRGEYGLYEDFVRGMIADTSKRTMRTTIENSKFLGRLVRTYETRGWKTLVLFEQDCQSVASAKTRLEQLMAGATPGWEGPGEHI